MIKNSLSAFKPSVHNIFKDKVNFILALIPIMIGVILYITLGAWVYGSLMDQGRALIEQYISEGALGSFVYYIVATIFTILLYFVINWTFVLIVTVMASPFNDLLSSRTEKKLRGEKLDSFTESMNIIGSTLIKTLFNEIKKVSFILVLSLISFVLGYVPLLTPFSLLITVLLLSVGFIDYSWSRHRISFASCVGDLRRNLISYGFGGTFFFILVSIPIVNLIVSPWATSYFTILWIKNNESRS